MRTLQLEVSWYRILDKSRVLWAKYSFPRYTGHPDLPGKMASPEDPGKSGSDCIIMGMISVTFHLDYFRVQNSWETGKVKCVKAVSVIIVAYMQ